MELNFCSLSTFLCQHNLTTPCISALKSSHLKSNKSLIIFPTLSFRKRQLYGFSHCLSLVLFSRAIEVMLKQQHRVDAECINNKIIGMSKLMNQHFSNSTAIRRLWSLCLVQTINTAIHYMHIQNFFFLQASLPLSPKLRN